MQLSLNRLPIEPAAPTSAMTEPAKTLYFNLLAPETGDGSRAAAADYLDRQLTAAAELPCDLPDDPEALPGWLAAGAAAVGREYQSYLDEREAGAPRRYFVHKAHAQHFLRGVAPTKLVDGAWLYGLLHRFADPRFALPIQAYLEELGEGRAEKNHVALYRKLLAGQGCDDWQELDDTHFVQGAIQLALAENAERFLPEVLGFNLGYERLPLHLLITACELRELGIDPYYFILHVTVDNVGDGHAKKAVNSLFAAWPRVGNSTDFYRRLRNGYRLNDLGASTPAVIDDFDPEREVVAVLRKKSALGRFMHSGHTRFAGRDVNEWLAEPGRVPGFLSVLQQRGWIKRHQNPDTSPFWRLIEGPRARMFGVFSTRQRQLIYDWIAGDWTRRGDTADPVRPCSSRPPRSSTGSVAPDDNFDAEIRLLKRRLAGEPDRGARLRMLVPLLAPALHSTHSGLFATRTFGRLFH
jgi:hypothetical protein